MPPMTDHLSRRDFLITTGGALVGLTAAGLVGRAAASTRHPQRKGTLQYGPHVDVAGVDPHLQNQNHIHQATAAMYNGLTDIDQQGNLVPSLAESWEANADLTEWTFRLRKGVLFHNGRELDAEAVKLNLMRIKNPAIGGDWERGAIETIDRVEVLDKYTVRIHAVLPDVSVPSSVMHYPTRLMAPDAFDTAAEHPIGTGPFKFVSWTRNNEARMVRFENYWETDAAGLITFISDRIAQIVAARVERRVQLESITARVALLEALRERPAMGASEQRILDQVLKAGDRAAALGAVIGIVGQVGDLAESLLKRGAGVLRPEEPVAAEPVLREAECREDRRTWRFTIEDLRLTIYDLRFPAFGSWLTSWEFLRKFFAR